MEFFLSGLREQTGALSSLSRQKVVKGFESGAFRNSSLILVLACTFPFLSLSPPISRSQLSNFTGGSRGCKEKKKRLEDALGYRYCL